jgi:diacylglycerol kinase
MSAFKSLARSFGHAFRGLALAFRSERSFRLQVVAAFAVIVVLIVLPLDLWERAILLLVTMFVLVLELLNSSLERLVDLAKPRLHEYAGDIKDLMAGSVLLAAMFALVLGLLILGPKLADIAMRL